MPFLDFELKGVLVKNGLRGEMSRQEDPLGYCTKTGKMIVVWIWLVVVETERSIKVQIYFEGRANRIS